MSNTKPPVIGIVGPTSSGKSNLAVDLALSITTHTHYSSAIVSADSRQVYKGLDIGSGKITQKEMKGIPHFMLDVASPKRTYSVSQFQKKASSVIARLHASSTIPIVCGGSGLYVDALLYGYRFPSIPPKTQVRKVLSSKTSEELFMLLKDKDPHRAKTIDAKNKRRLIRALEILDEKESVPPLQKTLPYTLRIYGIDLPQNILHARIHTRLLTRISQGMLEEVSSLHAKGISWKRLESLGLEYTYCSLVLQGKLSLEEMIPLLETKIRHFAKRQMTWFKRNKDITWISSPSLSQIENDTLDFLRSF